MLPWAAGGHDSRRGGNPLCPRGCALSIELKMQPELCKNQGLGETNYLENEKILCLMPSWSKAEACTPVSMRPVGKAPRLLFYEGKGGISLENPHFWSLNGRFSK